MEPTVITRQKVKTTLPVIPYPTLGDRISHKTPRLLIRPLTEDDLEALHVLRRVESVMIWTSQGHIDPDIEATKTKLAEYIPPNDKHTYNFAICERETGKFIGMGGNLWRQDYFGWPEVGYMLHPSAWGKGYATEFMKGFMEMWWALPRGEIEIEVAATTIKVDGDGEEGDVVREVVIGVTDEGNLASAKVLEKAGFVRLEDWIVENNKGNKGMDRLFVFACPRPRP